jgi:hypothetical protein
MELRDAALRVAAFLGIFLVVAVFFGLGAVPVPDGDENRTEPLTVESHQPDAILAAPQPEEGDVTVDASTTGRTIVIDQSHDNDVTADGIGPLVTKLVAAGHDVRFYTDAMANNSTLETTLADADAFVVVAPEEQYDATERAQVERFADDGGRVLLVNEPPIQGTAGATNETSMTNLASTFGLGFEAGYLYDQTDYDTNHRAVYATPAGEGGLADGVDRVTAYTARPVVGGTPVVVTNETTRLSTTRRQGTYAVLARQDNVTALGDGSLLGPDYVYTSDNEVLVGNLAEFLVTGSS